MREMKRIAAGLLCLTLLLGGMSLGLSEEVPSFRNAKACLAWVEEHQPMTLDLGMVKYSPSELLAIRNALPDGAAFSFEATIARVQYTPETRALDLNGSTQKISKADLEALIALLPELRSLETASHRELSSDIMPDIIDAHPEIQITWFLRLPYSYSLSTAFTAYSTMKNIGKEKRLRSEQCALFQYVPNMQALDLGHHALTDLDFLLAMPHLQLLILADNDITDVSVLGELKELRYVEIFMNDFTDLSPFSGCPELLDLNIVSTKVTSLDGLEGCTKLERLWAPRRSQLDEASIARFEAQHPNCELVFMANDCTGGGWRQHPRYKHYIACFKAHQWEPFQ